MKNTFRTFIMSLSMFSMVATPCFAISGGKVVAPDDPASKFSVIIMRDDGPICTGSYKGNQEIVTAAHCMFDKDNNPVDASRFQVYFGNIVQHHWNAALALKVANIKYDAKYLEQPEDASHDIGIMTFSGEAPTSFVPVDILTDPAQLQKNEHVVIAGFGDIYAPDSQNEPHNRTLRTFEETIKNTHSDKDIGIEFYKTKGGMREGDSGGPAYVIINGKPVLVGVCSGYTNGRPLYTNVATHADWLK